MHWRKKFTAFELLVGRQLLTDKMDEVGFSGLANLSLINVVVDKVQ